MKLAAAVLPLLLVGCHDDDDDDSGYCYYHYDPFDDDDGWTCDDDDDGWYRTFEVPGIANPVYSLEDFQVQTSAEENSHPVRSITNIRGMSVERAFGLDEYNGKKLAYYSAMVLESNKELLVLPPEAGPLVSEGIQRAKNGTVVVTYKQELAPSGCSVHFVYDHFGTLLEIHNYTLLDPRKER